MRGLKADKLKKEDSQRKNSDCRKDYDEESEIWHA